MSSEETNSQKKIKKLKEEPARLWTSQLANGLIMQLQYIVLHCLSVDLHAVGIVFSYFHLKQPVSTLQELRRWYHSNWWKTRW